MGTRIPRFDPNKPFEVVSGLSEEDQLTPYQRRTEKRSIKTREEDMALRAEERAHRRRMDEEALAARKEAAAARKEKDLEDRVGKYEKRLSDEGLKREVSALQAVERSIPATGDVPGYGTVVSHLPDIMVTQEGEDLRRQMSALFNLTLAERSGAAVTDQELARMRKEFGEGKWKSDDAIRKGLKEYRDRLNFVIRQTMAAYPQDVRDKFTSQGGFDYDRYANEGMAGPPDPRAGTQRNPELEALDAEIQALEAELGKK